MPLGKVKAVDLLRPGKFKVMSGRDVEITAADLEDIERNFQSFKQAPMVLGHKLESDTAAVGWPERIYLSGGKLKGDFEHIPKEVGAAVNSKQFRKISLSLQKGFKGLKGLVMKHVGLLGAALPAVEGLDDVPAIEFSADYADAEDAIILEFDSSSEGDAMKRKKAIEVLKKLGAPEVLFAESVPDEVVIELATNFQERAALTAKSDAAVKEAKEENEKLTVQLAEAKGEPAPKPEEGDKVSESVKKANELLAARTEDLATELVDGRRERIKAAIEKAKKEGRMAPAEEDGYLSLAESIISDTDKTVELAAPEGKTEGEKVTPFEAMVRQIDARTSLKAFGEMSEEDGELSEDVKKQGVIDLAEKKWSEEGDELSEAYTKKQWIDMALEGAGYTIET